MHKALNPRDDIDMYQEKKKGGRGLTNIEDSLDTSIRRLENYTKRTKKSSSQRPEATQTTQRSTEQQ